jgi:ParB-like chromosome segregation protein Spo0J
MPKNQVIDQLVNNVRRIDLSENIELRQSMQAFGWLKQFPAFADEHGVILVGLRRLKIARELGIEPVVETLKLGRGEQADAERLKLAIASNIGFKQMTKEDRQRIAEHLYGECEWTMARIAEALAVSEPTVHRDLKGSFIVKEPQRPKGGRPKGSTNVRVEASAPTPSAVQAWRNLQRDALRTSAMLDAIVEISGKNRPDASAFFAALDTMLAWKPVVGAMYGGQVDYAGRAQRIIDEIGGAVDSAVERLTAYQDMIKTYGSSPPPLCCDGRGCYDAGAGMLCGIAGDGKGQDHHEPHEQKTGPRSSF